MGLMNDPRCCCHTALAHKFGYSRAFVVQEMVPEQCMCMRRQSTCDIMRESKQQQPWLDAHNLDPRHRQLEKCTSIP